MHAVAQRHGLEEIEFQSLHRAATGCGWNVEPEVPHEIRRAALWICGIFPVKQAVVVSTLALYDEMLAIFVEIRRIPRVRVGGRIERPNASVVALAADSIVVIHGPVGGCGLINLRDTRGNVWRGGRCGPRYIDGIGCRAQMTSAGIPGSDVYRVAAARRKNYPGVHGRAEVAKNIDMVYVDHVSGYFEVTLCRGREVDWGSYVCAASRQLRGLYGYVRYGRVSHHAETDTNN